MTEPTDPGTPATAVDDLGPIDVLVIELPEDWAGEGLEPLLEMARRDVVRILDVEVVVRGEDGSATLAEPGSGPAAGLSGLSVFAGASSHLLDDEDAAEAAALLEPGRTGLVVVYENLWAATLAASLGRVGGHILAVGHLRADDLDATLAEH